MLVPRLCAEKIRVYAAERRGQTRGSDSGVSRCHTALYPGVAYYMTAFTADNSTFTEHSGHLARYFDSTRPFSACIGILRV